MSGSDAREEAMWENLLDAEESWGDRVPMARDMPWQWNGGRETAARPKDRTRMTAEELRIQSAQWQHAQETRTTTTTVTTTSAPTFKNTSTALDAFTAMEHDAMSVRRREMTRKLYARYDIYARQQWYAAPHATRRNMTFDEFKRTCRMPFNMALDVQRQSTAAPYPRTGVCLTTAAKQAPVRDNWKKPKLRVEQPATEGGLHQLRTIHAHQEQEQEAIERQRLKEMFDAYQRQMGFDNDDEDANDSLFGDALDSEDE